VRVADLFDKLVVFRPDDMMEECATGSIGHIESFVFLEDSEDFRPVGQFLDILEGEVVVNGGVDATPCRQEQVQDGQGPGSAIFGDGSTSVEEVLHEPVEGGGRANLKIGVGSIVEHRFDRLVQHKQPQPTQLYSVEQCVNSRIQRRHHRCEQRQKSSSALDTLQNVTEHDRI